MGAEQPKPGPLVQFALLLRGAILVDEYSPTFTNTPRQPGKQATIVTDGSDGHKLGNVIATKPQKIPAKNSQPL